MTKRRFTAFIQRQAASLLLLVAFGQFAVAAHAFDHGIADQTERCATCVHLEQGSQATASSGSTTVPNSSTTTLLPTVAQALVERRVAQFEARAPPL